MRVADTFVLVQSVIVDLRDRLWIVDTGSINLMPIVSKATPKLVCVDFRDLRQKPYRLFRVRVGATLIRLR